MFRVYNETGDEGDNVVRFYMYSSASVLGDRKKMVPLVQLTLIRQIRLCGAVHLGIR
jgi:hypothetical protein